MVHFLSERSHSVVIAIAIFVFVGGIIYSFSLGNSLRYPDEEEYFQIASNIVNHHTYSIDGVTPSAFKPPVYPIMLAFFIILGANVIALRVLTFFCLAISIFLLYAILKKQNNQLAGAIAAILVVSYPVLFYTAGTLYPQTLASFFILLVLYFATESSLVKNFLVGLLWGCFILIVPLFIYVLPLILFFYHITSPKRIFVLLCGALFLISLWAVRNYYHFGSFIPISTNSGLNLLLGNSENTTPNSGVNVDISKYQVDKHLNEIEKDVFYKSKAVEYILKNKLRAIKLYFAKAVNFFNYRNELATKSESSQTKDLAMLMSYGALLVLFVLRMVFYKRFPVSHFETFLITSYLTSPFFHAIFFTRIRFRLPIDYFLIIIVALFLSSLLNTKKSFSASSS